MSAEGKKFCPQAATDVELLNEIARNGSDHAVEELMNRHGALVRGAVRGVLKGQCPIEEIKDVEQEVWGFRIWRYRRPFDTSRGGSVAGLIWRIARNAALSHVLRTRKRAEERVDDNQLDILRAPESATQWLRDSRAEQSFVVFDLVDRALSELNDEHSRLVFAIMNEKAKETTYKEFAKRFNTTESNVKQVMYRFKQRYMKLLAEYRDGNGH